MFSVKSFIQFCIAASVMLLPLAHLKGVFWGVPLYSVEAPVLLALMAYLYGWKRGLFFPLGRMNFRSPLAIGAALFFLGALVSFVANPFSLMGLGMLKTWFIFPLLALWLWLQTEPSVKDLERILLVWLWIIGVSALASLFYFAQGELTYDGRLAAWYTSPNYLALFLAPGALLAHYFYFHPSSLKMRILKPVLFLVLILLMVALFFTHSYAVWISIAMAGLLYLFFDITAVSSWRKKLVAILLFITIFGTFILFESGSEKWQAMVSQEERSSLASRVTIWQVAVRVISDHPLLGIGIGRFQEVYLAYQKYYPPYLEWAVPQPHNLYLAVWLEAGLIGLIGFALLIVYSIRVLLQNKNRESVLLLGLLAFYLIYGLFDTPFFKTDLAFTFWLVMALILTISKPAAEFRM